MPKEKSERVRMDAATRKWFDRNPFAQTTVMRCECCGLYYKPSLGHKCKKEGDLMKQQIELTCATCGKKFTEEADVITPGISGFVNTANGELVRFLDPTEEHHCEDCLQRVLDYILTKQSDRSADT